MLVVASCPKRCANEAVARANPIFDIQVLLVSCPTARVYGPCVATVLCYRHATKRKADEASREDTISATAARVGASQEASKDDDGIRLAKTKGDWLGKSISSPAGDSGEADEERPGT